MATNPMQPMGGDSGDSSELQDLETRVSAIEQKLGMNLPQDDSAPAPMKKGPPMGKPGAAPFFGSY